MPAIFRQQRHTGGEIAQRRNVRSRSLGALTRGQIELGELLALRHGRDQARAAVELIYDVKDCLLPLFGRCVRREQSAYSEVCLDAQLLRNHRISALLNAIVDEPVGARRAFDQLLTAGGPQSRVDLLLGNPEDDRKCCNLGDVSKTSQLLQRILRVGRQADELPDHKINDVIGVSLGMNTVEIPGPARGVMVEGDQGFFGERRQELHGEKRIAAGLLMRQLRKRNDALHLAAKSVRNQLPEMLPGEWRQRDLCNLSAGGLDGVELAHERMRRTDFVVAIGTDQHEVLQIRPRQQVIQQIERRRVEPLQIIQEEGQRMFGLREYADEPLEHQLKAALCLLWRKLRRRRLVSDNEREFGDEVGHEPPVRAQRLQKGVAPASQLGVTLAEQRPDQALKSLYQRGIGDVALVLVELAGGE